MDILRDSRKPMGALSLNDAVKRRSLHVIVNVMLFLNVDSAYKRFQVLVGLFGGTAQ